MDATQVSVAPAIPERVTHVKVRLVPLDGLADLALITLDNGEPANRPNSFGLRGLAELAEAVEGLRPLVAAGQVSAVAVTGKPGSFGAGADLFTFAAISEPATARLYLARGKAAFGTLRDLGLPSFAFVNGLALGGGLEAALFCDYRTVAAGVRAIGLPESYLGLVPGWGGTYHLPRLVGAENALRVIVDNPQSGNRLTNAKQAFELGIFDALLDGDDGDFLQSSLTWASSVLRGEHEPARPDVLADTRAWMDAVDRRRPSVERLARAGAPAAAAALALVTSALTAPPIVGLALEEDTCTDLLMSDTLRGSLYAFDLLGHRARRPAGVPREAASRPVRTIAVVGGAPALDQAVAIAAANEVPVTLVVPDEDAAAHAKVALEERCAMLAAQPRRGLAAAGVLRSHLSVSTATDAVAAADVVVAVPDRGERADAVDGGLAPVWELADADAVIVVVSQSSDVIRAAAGRARRPERVVGWCEASASAPLVELVRAAATDGTSLASAADLVARQRRTAVVVGAAEGFVLGRVRKTLREAVAQMAEGGVTAATIDDVLVRFGLPSGVTVLGTDALAGDAQPVTVTGPLGSDDVEALVGDLQDRLARTVADLLASGVVEDVRDVDVVMLAGAGFPLHLGGIVPALDRSGAPQRVAGGAFLDSGVATVPAAGSGF